MSQSGVTARLKSYTHMSSNFDQLFPQSGIRVLFLKQFPRWTRGETGVSIVARVETRLKQILREMDRSVMGRGSEVFRINPAKRVWLRFSVAFNSFEDFSCSPPRAALPALSSAGRIFNDTRAVPLPGVPCVVAQLGESRQAAQPPHKPPFCRYWPSIPISKRKPNRSSVTRRDHATSCPDLLVETSSKPVSDYRGSLGCLGVIRQRLSEVVGISCETNTSACRATQNVACVTLSLAFFQRKRRSYRCDFEKRVGFAAENTTMNSGIMAPRIADAFLC